MPESSQQRFNRVFQETRDAIAAGRSSKRGEILGALHMLKLAVKLGDPVEEVVFRIEDLERDIRRGEKC